MRQPRKHDAFDKMVQKAVHGDAVLTQIEAVQLLRAYHRKVVRLVTRQARCGLGQESIGDFILIHPLLDALDHLKNGTQP